MSTRQKRTRSKVLALLFVAGAVVVHGDLAPKTIYAVDAIGLGRPLVHTLTSFQGIVNRGRPRLFVRRSDACEAYLEDLINYYGYTVIELDNYKDAFEQPELTAICDSFVVYDIEDCDLALNAALTQAGILGACAVNIDDVDLMVNTYGFSQHADSDADLAGKWSSNEACQQWQYNHQRSKCTDSITGIGVGTYSGRYKGQDFQVYKNMFLWCLDSTPHFMSDYETTQKDILSTYDPYTIAFGRWENEGKDVAALSNKGLIEVGAGPNISIYSQLPKPASNLTQVASGTLREYDNSKTYIFISFTQGDAMSFCQEDNLGYMTAASGTETNYLVRERYPFGMMQGTTQWDLQPNVPGCLYSIMDGNQYFVGKGYGYTDPTTFYDKGYIDGWLAISREAMEHMGHKDIFVNDNEIEASPDNSVIEYICKELQPRAMILKHQLDTTGDEDDDPVVYNGVPVFGDPVFNRDDNDGFMKVNETFDAIVASAAKRKWFWVFLDHNTKIDSVEQLMDKLVAEKSDEIVVMPPDEFIRLYMKKTFGVGSGIVPDEDAMVQEASPDDNYGGNTSLRVRSSATGGKVFSFLKFTVSGSPDSAVLHLRTEDKGIEECTVFSVSNTGWDEDSITWNSKPPMGSVLDTVSNVSAYSWAHFDVSSHITGSGSYSLGLRTIIDGAGRDWCSKENPAFSPVLELTYSKKFNPSDDAMVQENDPNANYGSSTALRVRSSATGGKVKSFLKFTVADISGEITSAVLKVRAEDKDIEDCTAYIVNNTNWDESTITWSSKPPMGASLDSVSNVSAGARAAFDVSSYVTNNGTYSIGLHTTIDGAGLDWYSKESSYEPVLIITYKP